MGTKQYDSATDLITFSRNSTATYTDSDGNQAASTANQPRIDYDESGNLKGLLIEEQRTNSFLNSDSPETQVVAVTPNTAHTLSFEGGSSVVDLDETIASNAVDVFVYDTSKDSDGGAWRTGTLAQATSWYNETLNTSTRGSRQEFPAVAVIVAEATKVTIYDGDDPDLPMWMVFNAVGTGLVANGNIIARQQSRNITSVTALNGQLFVSGDFTTDIRLLHDNAKSYTANLYTYKGNIEQRNDSLGYPTVISGGGVVNNQSNDVAMTVLPDAPIDPATGLPVPTIAVATDGGVSVIKDDGTVVDIYHTDSALVEYVTLSEGLIVYDANDFYHARLIPEADVNAGLRYFRNANDVWFAPRFASPSYGGPSFQLHPTGGSPKQVLQWGNSVAIANFDRLNRAIVSDTYGVNNALANFTTSTYNTGWMQGDIKLATLSDTDDTDVVGSELVTNGTFDSDTSGWTGSSASLSVSSGELVVTSSAAYGKAVQSVTTVIGETYTISAFAKAGTVAARVEPYPVTSGSGISVTSTSGESISITFVASSTSTEIQLKGQSSSTGTSYYDNISVRLAEADRSVNGNGLQVFGTVTKTAVATGADLVAYSGWSGSNYLEQPYNSDLDFGTGDFCVMGWVKAATARDDCFMDRQDGAGSNTARLQLKVKADGTLQINVAGDTAYSPARGDATWSFFTFARTSGVVTGYIDGLAGSPVSLAGSLTASHTTVVGKNGSTSDVYVGSLALLRISATAPTAEQIAKIYEDEKVLFQAGAQATLYGSSDAVKALAHDEDTGLLHVGTSAGRSVFNGLNRINNTTTGVTTAISAVNGIIGEQ